MGINEIWKSPRPIKLLVVAKLPVPADVAQLQTMYTILLSVSSVLCPQQDETSSAITHAGGALQLALPEIAAAGERKLAPSIEF